MFITIVTKCYYTCDLYYICDQLLHLCLQQMWQFYCLLQKKQMMLARAHNRDTVPLIDKNRYRKSIDIVDIKNVLELVLYHKGSVRVLIDRGQDILYVEKT